MHGEFGDEPVAFIDGAREGGHRGVAVVESEVHDGDERRRNVGERGRAIHLHQQSARDLWMPGFGFGAREHGEGPRMALGEARGFARREHRLLGL